MREKNSTNTHYISSIFYLGCIFLVLGIVVGAPQYIGKGILLDAFGEATTGTITHKRVESTRSKVTYYATISFSAKGSDGSIETVSQELDIGLTDYERLSRGSSVQITYLPAMPSICIVGEPDYHIPLLIWGGITFGSLSIGIIGLLASGGFTALIRQSIGCGTILVILGLLALLAPFVGEILADYLVWELFRDIGLRFGSMQIAGGLSLALGIGIILIGIGVQKRE